MVFENGTIRIDESLVETEAVIENDKRTFKLIKKIGDEIHKSIKLETDVPSNYEDGKLPILDLKVWLETKTMENGKKIKIIHEHYQKEVSSKLLIHKESAISIKTKRTVLTQQCLRVILNCSPLIQWEETNKHLTYFMARMQASGYNQKLRFEILQSALKAYQVIVEKDQEGEQPMYRMKEWQKNRRRKEKEKKGREWYTKGGTESVLFVPATPNSQLQKLFQREVNQSDINIKVIEQSGTKLINILKRNNPFKPDKCNEDDCLVCRTSVNGNCRTTGVTYEILCRDPECPYKYTGQTSSNGYTRGLKHNDEYENKRKQSPLWKHCQKVHNNEEQTFQMCIKDRCRNDPTKRQILEAIRIRETDPQMSMNERTEWNVIKLPHIQIT